MRDIRNEFGPYELALRMKALGFDEPCFGWYEHNSNFYYCYQEGLVPPSPSKKLIKGAVKAPTFQQAFRWFREKYVLLGFIEPANGYEDKSLFAFYICDDEQNIVDDSHSYSKDSSLHFNTHEEAELACLEKLCEIVEQNKEVWKKEK
jgi:hypothetical protein